MTSPLLRELLDSGIPEIIAQELIDSGHYRLVSADEAKKLIGVQRAGWVVQFPDLAGQGPLRISGPTCPPFVRLKPVPALEQRNGDKPPRYLTASGAGCRPYFSPLLLPVARDPKGTCDIDFTEGEKKADTANAHGFPTIGLSGVDCWRDRRSGTSAFLPELEAINWKGRTVRIVFDSDIAHKAGVRSATRELAFELTRRGAEVLITTIPCEIPSGPGNPTPGRWKNGLDDFIARHGAEAYRILRTIARPCVKTTADGGLEWIWAPEPGRNDTRDKALLAWTVFKDYCAVDSARGFLHWVGTHWTALEGKPEECLAKPFLDWCDAMGWKRTGLGAVPKQVVEELRIARAWDPPHLMAFANGTLDTRSNTFSAGHRRQDHITLCLPFAYKPLAPCPRWHAFINEALGGDQGLIELLRALIRWTLEPKDRDRPFSNEVAIDVFGPAGHGKGVLFEILACLLGGIGQGVARLDVSSLGKPTALHQLLGKRLAVDSDASGHIENAGIFNAIVSNEPVTVKKLYVNETTLRLGVVVWRFFNDAITVSGGGVEGMGRRIITFTFDKTPRLPDRKLKEKLREELPGIFAWAWGMDMEAAERTIGNAAQNQAIAEAAIDAAFKRNPKFKFLSENFPEGKAIEIKILFSMWKNYAKTYGHKAGCMPTFAAEIVKIAGEPKRQGRRKITSYQIPPMACFDWAAHLRLPGAEAHVDANRTEGERQVDVIPASAFHPVDANAAGCRPPDVHPVVHPASTQNHCPDSLLSYVDVTSSSEKKVEEKEERLKDKAAQTPLQSRESLHPPISTSTPLRSGPRGCAGGALRTVGEQIEDALQAARLGPSHPSAASAAHDALKGSGISRNQIELALEQIRREEQADQGELL